MRVGINSIDKNKHRIVKAEQSTPAENPTDERSPQDRALSPNQAAR
jgi:hypothetical protein